MGLHSGLYFVNGAGSLQVLDGGSLGATAERKYVGAAISPSGALFAFPAGRPEVLGGYSCGWFEHDASQFCEPTAIHGLIRC